MLELLDEARHAQAVADRASRRMIAEADDQDATFAGSLLAAAEAATVVLLDTTVGRTVRGRLLAVGPTHCVLTDGSATSWIRVDGVTTVRRVSGGARLRASGGDEVRSEGAAVIDALTELAHERTPVDAHLVGGAVVRGEVHRVGTDVVTLRTPTSGDVTLVQLPLLVVLTVHHGAS